MYRQSTLENGIRVISENIPGVRSVSMCILADASPRHEHPQKSGAAHLTEHMLFSGTSNRNTRQIAELMDTAGGQMGGFTSRDYTCLYATVLDEHLTYALDLLGDIMLNSIFPPERLKREKDAVMRELAGCLDAPELRSHDLLKSHIWQNHPLGRPVIGLPETVPVLSREDLIYFFHENYVPDRLIIAAAGNIEHDDFNAQVQDGFWRMMGNKPAAPPTAPPQFQAGAAAESSPLNQTYFSLGFPFLPYAHKDRFLAHLLVKIIGGGISSRLYRRLRENQGLVYQIHADYHAYLDGGLFLIEGSTAPDAVIPVLSAIFAELCALANRQLPVSDEELWKAKMQIRGQYLIESEQTSTRMSRLATQMFYFNQYFGKEQILSQIEAIGAEAMNDFAQFHLGQGLPKGAVATLGPNAAETPQINRLNHLLQFPAGT